MIDFSVLTTPIIIASLYLTVGSIGIFLSRRAGHTNVVSDDVSNTD